MAEGQGLTRGQLKVGEWPVTGTRDAGSRQSHRSCRYHRPLAGVVQKSGVGIGTGGRLLPSALAPFSSHHVSHPGDD